MEIARGAEAVISHEHGKIVKERVKKGYRIEEFDGKLREKRTRLEARLLREARRAGVLTPLIEKEDKFSIEMEFIEGSKVKDVLSEENFKVICFVIGEKVAKLHSCGIIHGDLTTSNMILKGYDGKQTHEMRQAELYFIDFGLGSHSQRIEDMGTDLHVLKEALQSTHFSFASVAWEAVLKGYSQSYADSDKVIKTLSKIEKRGRYSER